MFGYLASELVGRSTPFIFHLESELVARAAQLSQQLNRSIAPDFSGAAVISCPAVCPLWCRLLLVSFIIHCLYDFVFCSICL